MYIEVYLFYISLTGIIILLLYKSLIVRKYDKANQNHLYFNSFPKVRLWIIENFNFAEKKIKKYIIKPFLAKSLKNIVLIKRGAVRFVDDIRYGKRKLGDMMEKTGTASGYMQTIIDKKKEIRKKAHKSL